MDLSSLSQGTFNAKRACGREEGNSSGQGSRTKRENEGNLDTEARKVFPEVLLCAGHLEELQCSHHSLAAVPGGISIHCHPSCHTVTIPAVTFSRYTLAEHSQEGWWRGAGGCACLCYRRLSKASKYLKKSCARCSFRVSFKDASSNRLL